MGKKAWWSVFLVLWAGALLSLCPLLLAEEERDQALEKYLEGVVQKVTGRAFLFDARSKEMPSEERVRQALMDKDAIVATAGARELLFYPGLAKEALGPGLAGMAEARKALLRQTLFDLGGLAAEWVLQQLAEPYQGPWADDYRRYFLERRHEGYGTVWPGRGKDGVEALAGEKLEGKGAGPKPSARYLQLAYQRDGLQIFRYTELANPPGVDRSISGEFLVFRQDGRTLPMDGSKVFWVFPGQWDGEGGYGSGGEWVFWKGGGGYYLYAQGRYGEIGSVLRCSFSKGQASIQALAQTGPPAYPMLPAGDILFHGLSGDSSLYALDLGSLKDKQVVEGPLIREVGEGAGDGPTLPVTARLGMDKKKNLLFHGLPLLPLTTWEHPLNSVDDIDAELLLKTLCAEHANLMDQVFPDVADHSGFADVKWPEAGSLKKALKPLGQGRWRMNLATLAKKRILAEIRIYRAGSVLAVFIDSLQLMQATKDGFETVKSLPSPAQERP